MIKQVIHNNNNNNNNNNIFDKNYVVTIFCVWPTGSSATLGITLNKSELDCSPRANDLNSSRAVLIHLIFSNTMKYLKFEGEIPVSWDIVTQFQRNTCLIFP